MLPNRQPLVSLGWPPSRQRRGNIVKRDPDDPYSRQVRLRDLPKSHWLHVPRAAYERLTSAESFKLVVPCEHGGYSDVECCRADLHNLYRDASSGDVFHCIAIAVHKGCVHLCRQCAFGWDQSYSTPAVQYPRGDDTLAGDQYNDLYHSNAPTGSVASGLDFGTFRILSGKGVDVCTSTLERLLLSQAKMYLSLASALYIYMRDHLRFRLRQS